MRGKALILTVMAAAFSFSPLTANIINTPDTGGLTRVAENRRNPGNASAVAAGNFNGSSTNGDMALGSPRSSGFLTDDSGSVYALFGHDFTQPQPTEEELFFDFTARPDAVTNPLFSSVFEDPTAGFQVLPERGGEFFGQTLAAGDFDGDGFDDLAIGAPAPINNAGPGAVYLLYGRADIGGLLSIDTEIFNGDGFEIKGVTDTPLFGERLFMDDLDNDGMSELVIASPQAVNGGLVFIIWGRERSSDPTLESLQLSRETILGTNLKTTISSDTAGEDFGAALSAGDIDGDDRKELFIGAPLWPAPPSARGRVVGLAVDDSIPSISLATSVPLVEYQGSILQEALGKALAFGDVLGDDTNDLAIGAPDAGDNSQGKVYMVHPSMDAGPPRTLPASAVKTLLGDAGFGRFGFALGIAELNSLAGEDLVVGEPGFDTAGQIDSGRVFILRGRRFPSESIFTPASSSTEFNEFISFGSRMNAGWGFAFTNFDGRFPARQDLVIGTSGLAPFPEFCDSEDLTDWQTCHNAELGTRAFIGRSGVFDEPSTDLSADHAWMMLP